MVVPKGYALQITAFVPSIAPAAASGGHGRTAAVARRGYSPPTAWATARNRARPLFMVSSHSVAGSES